MYVTASLFPWRIVTGKKHDVLVSSVIVTSNMGIKMRMDAKQTNG